VVNMAEDYDCIRISIGKYNYDTKEFKEKCYKNSCYASGLTDRKGLYLQVVELMASELYEEYNVRNNKNTL